MLLAPYLEENPSPVTFVFGPMENWKKFGAPCLHMFAEWDQSGPNGVMIPENGTQHETLHCINQWKDASNIAVTIASWPNLRDFAELHGLDLEEKPHFVLCFDDYSPLFDPSATPPSTLRDLPTDPYLFMGGSVAYLDRLTQAFTGLMLPPLALHDESFFLHYNPATKKIALSTNAATITAGNP